MTPQATETRLPPGYTLAPRLPRLPRHDEPPVLRDPAGRVLATVERWLLDLAH